MSSVLDFQVRYSETDQMGRAHHRHYLVWFELGRTALMKECGVSYAELERSGTWLPVSRVEVEYSAPVKYDYSLRLYSQVERVRSREVVFGYRLVDEGKATIATGRTCLVCTDDEGRTRRLPVDLREALEKVAVQGPRT